MAFLSGSSIRRLPRPACLERTVGEALGAELAQLSACPDGGSYLPDFRRSAFRLWCEALHAQHGINLRG